MSEPLLHYRRDTVCIYSGGMDSYTLMNDLYESGWLHSCLTFKYGQKHLKEIEYATVVMEYYDAAHHVIDLETWGESLPGSALIDPRVEMPEGHYTAENMKQTVVPNRNMVMLALAVGYAVAHGVPYVAYAAHAGDHAIYPDCREPFLQAFNKAVEVGNWGKPVTVVAPYLHLDKTGILRIGFELGLNYVDTWTCYRGGTKACGKCGACQERLEAFKNIGKVDPLEYQE
jgi:7-cyano-7-deazaguanine synthase